MQKTTHEITCDRCKFKDVSEEVRPLGWNFLQLPGHTGDFGSYSFWKGDLCPKCSKEMNRFLRGLTK